MEVQDLLNDPPEDNPYEKLKEQLISRIADSEHQTDPATPHSGGTWGRQTHPVASQNAATAGWKDARRQFAFM